MGQGEVRLLVDLNIVLDVLQKREPYLERSKAVWRLAETGQIEAFLAAHSVTTLFYLAAKQLGPQGAAALVQETLKVFSAAAVDQEVIENALQLNWQDFEDAVQMAAALAANLDYVVTRHRKDYSERPIPVLEPAELLSFV